MGTFGPGSEAATGVLPHGSDREARLWALREQRKADARCELWRQVALGAEHLLEAMANLAGGPGSDEWAEIAARCLVDLEVAKAYEAVHPFTRRVHPDDLDEAQIPEGVA